MKLIVASFLLILNTSTDAPGLHVPRPANPAPFPENLNAAERQQWDSRQRAQLARFIEDLPNMQVNHVYTISGRADPEQQPDPTQHTMHGYMISTHTEVIEEQSASGVMQQSIRALLTSNPSGEEMCFYPFHMVSLTNGSERIDVVTCFECSKLMIVSDGDGLQGMFPFVANDEMDRWKAYFASAGIR